MKSNQKFCFSIFAILASLVFLLAPSVEAESRSYYTTVTIDKYYGLRGHDAYGNYLYGVKVHQGDNYYYVELLNPMPCLSKEKNQKKTVKIHRTDHSMTASFEGRTVEIYQISKLENATSSSPFYHDTPSHQHHKSKPKSPWDLFKWW